MVRYRVERDGGMTAFEKKLLGGIQERIEVIA
jgi:hypothetical protein